MREYESREEAEMDQDLDLHYIWVCDQCSDEMELSPQQAPGSCSCGGTYIQSGESYNA